MCQRCLLTDVEKKLIRFYKILKQDPHAFDGKFSFFSCRNNCENSKLSINYQQCLRIISESEKNRIENKKILKYLEVGANFFFGIMSFFERCLFCKKIVSFLGFRSIICQKCIKEVCVRQMGVEPRVVTIESSETEEKYSSFIELFDSEPMIINYDERTNSYTVSGVLNGFMIEFSEPRDSHMKVFLIKIISVSERNRNFAIIQHPSDIKMICLVHLYF
jgi:hypothetical protein